MAKLTSDQVVAGLVRRGVPLHVAQGVAMNFRDESGFETGIQERNPRAGRGGYGLAQWTGPRRVGLENYAAQRGASTADPDVQLDYFMAENAGPERAAWSQVMQAPTAQQAASQFVTHWERPAPEHRASRVNRYLNATPGSVGQWTQDMQPPMPAPPQPMNAMQTYANAIVGGGNDDWLENKSYSVNALASDFLAGRNPMRRFIYQKLFG